MRGLNYRTRMKDGEEYNRMSDHVNGLLVLHPERVPFRTIIDKTKSSTYKSEQSRRDGYVSVLALAEKAELDIPLTIKFRRGGTNTQHSIGTVLPHSIWGVWAAGAPDGAVNPELLLLEDGQTLVWVSTSKQTAGSAAATPPSTTTPTTAAAEAPNIPDVSRGDKLQITLANGAKSNVIALEDINTTGAIRVFNMSRTNASELVLPPEYWAGVEAVEPMGRAPTGEALWKGEYYPGVLIDKDVPVLTYTEIDTRNRATTYYSNKDPNKQDELNGSRYMRVWEAAGNVFFRWVTGTTKINEVLYNAKENGERSGLDAVFFDNDNAPEAYLVPTGTFKEDTEPVDTVQGVAAEAELTGGAAAPAAAPGTEQGEPAVVAEATATAVLGTEQAAGEPVFVAEAEPQVDTTNTLLSAVSRGDKIRVTYTTGEQDDLVVLSNDDNGIAVFNMSKTNPRQQALPPANVADVQVTGQASTGNATWVGEHLPALLIERNVPILTYTGRSRDIPCQQGPRRRKQRSVKVYAGVASRCYRQLFRVGCRYRYNRICPNHRNRRRGQRS